MGLWVTPKGSIDRASPGTGSSPPGKGRGELGRGTHTSGTEPWCWSHPWGSRRCDTGDSAPALLPSPGSAPSCVLSPSQAWCRETKTGHCPKFAACSRISAQQQNQAASDHWPAARHGHPAVPTLGTHRQKGCHRGQSPQGLGPVVRLVAPTGTQCPRPRPVPPVCMPRPHWCPRLSLRGCTRLRGEGDPAPSVPSGVCGGRGGGWWGGEPCKGLGGALPEPRARARRESAPLADGDLALLTSRPRTRCLLRAQFVCSGLESNQNKPPCAVPVK